MKTTSQQLTLGIFGNALWVMYLAAIALFFKNNWIRLDEGNIFIKKRGNGLCDRCQRLNADLNKIGMENVNNIKRNVNDYVQEMM